MNIRDNRTKSAVPIWELRTDHCRARVISAGAMLQDVVFSVGEGRDFRPFAQAKWSADAREGRPTEQPLHLQHLGGEWPCVPYGSSAADPEHHGFGSNHFWQCDAISAGAIELSIDYPADHVVRRVTRRIALSETEPTISCSFTVEARKVCRLPIGIHPIFRLPETGNVELIVAGAQRWAAIPAPFRPNGARIIGTGAQSLTDDSGVQVLFPRDFHNYTAELVQAFDLPGRVDLVYPDAGARASLTWDSGKLPHCHFWLAKPHEFGGLGPFRGLAVEPIASWFDRGCEQIGETGNGAKGAFGVDLIPESPWTFEYKITAEDLGQD